MADSLILLYQLLNALLQTFTSLFSSGLQTCDNVTFLLQILMFLTTLTGTGSIAGFEELVACTKEFLPQLVA